MLLCRSNVTLQQHGKTFMHRSADHLKVSEGIRAKCQPMKQGVGGNVATAPGTVYCGQTPMLKTPYQSQQQTTCDPAAHKTRAQRLASRHLDNALLASCCNGALPGVSLVQLGH